MRSAAMRWFAPRFTCRVRAAEPRRTYAVGREWHRRAAHLPLPGRATVRHQREVQLRARWRRDRQGQVRTQLRDSCRDRRHAPARIAGLHRRRGPHRAARALLRVPAFSIPHHPAILDSADAHLDRPARVRRAVHRFRVAGRGAAVRRPGDRVADHRGVGVVRLESSRAPRADIDALRLLAVFLAHWDNESENRRLAVLTISPRSPTGRVRSRC